MTVVAPVWQRLEGLALLAVSVLAYARFGEGWLLFAVLFLTPDLSFFGYLAGPRIGAHVYNCAHIYALPLLLTVLGVALGSTALIAAGGLWLAHVGADRALGLGLKLPDGFRDTHLGRIGHKY